MRVALPFSGEITMGAGVIRYAWPFLGTAGSTPGLDTVERFIVIPKVCTIISLYVVSRVQGGLVTNPSPPPAELAVTGTYTVRKNGADTGLQLAIQKNADADLWTGTAASSVAFAAGDRLSLKVIYDQAFDGEPSGINHVIIAEF